MKYAWFLVPAALAACGQPIPLWTKDYAQEQTTRSYAGVPPAKLLAAAEQVVRLAGAPRDVQIKPTPAGAVADRYYVGFIGMRNVTIDYTFTLGVTPAGKGSAIDLGMRASIADFSDDDLDILPSPYLNQPQIQIADPYKLFFARLDYLLGKRPDWVSCAEAPAKLGAVVALDPLCYQAVDAGTPPRI